MNAIKKFTVRYKNIPIQARASFWFLFCSILQNGLNIITLPIFTRILTTEQYGLSSSYFAWNDLIVVVCTLRLSYGVFDKGMVKYEVDRNKFTSALLGLTTAISVSMTVLFLIFHSIIEKALGMSFLLCLSLFIVQIFAPALLFWTARNRYEYRYQKFTAVTLSTSICCTLLNLFAVLKIPYDSGEVKVLSYQVVWCVVYVIFYVFIFSKGKCFYDKGIWKYALRFNMPLIPYFLSTLILDKADRIMIGNFCGNSEVALYSVSYNIGRLMVLVTSALDATFTPWIYQKIKENKFNNTKKISASIMVMFLGMATVFMLFAPELITFFAAKQYRDAVYIIPPVVVSYFFIMMYGLVSKVEFYYEKTKSIAVITVIAAALDIVLNYFAIPEWGYVAAGYTTLISYLFMSIGHFVLSGRISKEKGIFTVIFPWKLLIILSLIMIAVMLGVNLLYKSFILRYSVLLLLVLYAVIFRKKIIAVFTALKK